MSRNLKAVVNNDKKQDKFEVREDVFCTDERRYKEEMALDILEEMFPIASVTDIGCAVCSNTECELHLERVGKKQRPRIEGITVPF